MGLSSDLIAQFVKVTNDNTKAKKETTVYGTTVEYEGSTYVKLDGSDLLTPISTTADTKPDERVTVMIKNHAAVITGNISSPAARLDDVKDITDTAEEVNNKISEFEIAIGNKVSVDDLDTERGRIDNLISDNAHITELLTANEAAIDVLQTNVVNISESVTANSADIENLQTTKLDAKIAEVTYATIESLDATNANVYNLQSTYGDFKILTTDKIDAINATIDNLGSTYATIESLEVEQARITDLEADIGDIDTLIFGSASGDTIQTSFANSVIAQLGDAQIKSAMIESIAANKITSGDIITNNVRVKSEDGSLLISDETIQISDDKRVRVQIGKDASGDYSINIWDQNGNLMFSEGGITDSAIKNAIIRNDMVSDTANIAAHKLDIDSLFEEINGSTNTIKSTQILIDDQEQTLNVAFKTLSSDVGELQNNLSSQGTEISAIQGQISSKIWQQDINTATNELEEQTEALSTQYTTLQQELDGISTTVASHTAEIQNKADSSTVTNISDRVTNVETNLDGFKTTVSDTYTTKTDFSNMKIGGRNLFEKSGELTSSAIQLYSWLIQSITVGEDSTVPSGQYLAITMGESDETFLGGPYLSASFGKYIPKMIKGELYTISVWVKCSTAKTIGVIHPEFLTWVNSSVPTLSTEWQRYVVTGIYNGNSDKQLAITFYYASHWTTGDVFYISSPMVEYGNKVSDWKPAPEDLATYTELTTLNNRVSSAETSITQNANNISSVATRATTLETRVTNTETNINQNADNITAVATRTTTNESDITTLKLEADGLTVRLGEAESNIATAQSTADSANTAAVNAQTTANTAKSNAATAQSTANTANSTANTALTNTKLQSDITNYAQLNDDTASYWGFTADNTADGHWYTMNSLSRDKFISGWHQCKGGETFKISFEISTSCMGNVTWGETETTYRGTAIGLYGYNAAGTSTGISYSTRVMASADAPATTVSCTARVYSSARKFRVFVQTETWAYMSGTIKIRNVRVEKIDEEAAKTATNYLNFSSSGLVVGDHTGSSLGKNVLIDSDSVDIRNNTTVLASFGESSIELGKHSKTSTIDLCKGTGTIRADVYDPVINSTYGSEGLFLESPERIVLDSDVINLNCDNKGESDSGYNQVYISNWVTESSAYFNVEAVDQNTVDGTTNFGRFEARSHDLINVLGMDAAENEPYAMVEARNASYLNRLYMYPTFSRMTQKLLTTGGIISKGNIIIGADAYGEGGRALGVNKILWSGGYYMTSGHTATLSEAVSVQPNGIVLVFSEYIDSAVSNTAFHTFFVPKQVVASHAGVGHCMQMTSSNLAYFATKYLYISDTKIVGHDNNSLTGASTSGITRSCNRFILRYVIGV